MATAGKAAASKPAPAATAAKDSRKSTASTGSNSRSNSSKSATASGSAKSSANSEDAAGAKKPSLKPGEAAGAAVLLWPNGKPILGSGGKPIDPAILTVVVEKDGKSVVHGPDGKPFLLPDGKALDPALVPEKEEPPPPPPPKPYLGVPPPRFLRPPWEKPPWQGGLPPPRFLPYSPMLLKAAKLKLPPQVEFQDAAWGRTILNLRSGYPRLVSLHLGPVGVTFEKHAGPVQCFIHILCRDVPDIPELLGKPQFSTCNFCLQR